LQASGLFYHPTIFNALNYGATAVIDNESCLYGGCIAPDNKYYDPNADVDDKSCRFEGSVILWYGESVAADLANYGVTLLTCYLMDKM